jgi:N utilization substance protein B
MSKQKRSQARQYALQAIYQWQITGQSIGIVESQFLENEALAQADVALFLDLIRGVAAKLPELDTALTAFMTRELEQIDFVERAALRIGAYELMQHPETPYRIVINEAVELTKIFGAEQGHRYVNAVLDKLARQVRSDEISQRA